MVEYRCHRHRKVARILDAFDEKVLLRSRCFFGGGTRIALELGEYRESEDIDFICSDLSGYRALRSRIDARSLGDLMPELQEGLSLLRDVRADQYGIRTVFGVDGEPVKFEIILEARIQVSGMKVRGIPVPALDRVSCFAEKWLANADRWNDTAVLSRDAIDLAFMLMAWDIKDGIAGARLAANAYGAAIVRAALSASTRLLEDSNYRRQCAGNLAVDDAKNLLSGLKVFPKVLKALS